MLTQHSSLTILQIVEKCLKNTHTYDLTNVDISHKYYTKVDLVCKDNNVPFTITIEENLKNETICLLSLRNAPNSFIDLVNVSQTDIIPLFASIRSYPKL